MNWLRRGLGPAVGRAGCSVCCGIEGACRGPAGGGCMPLHAARVSPQTHALAVAYVGILLWPAYYVCALRFKRLGQLVLAFLRLVRRRGHDQHLPPSGCWQTDLQVVFVCLNRRAPRDSWRGTARRRSDRQSGKVVQAPWFSNELSIIMYHLYHKVLEVAAVLAKAMYAARDLLCKCVSHLPRVSPAAHASGRHTGCNAVQLTQT